MACEVSRGSDPFAGVFAPWVVAGVECGVEEGPQATSRETRLAARTMALRVMAGPPGRFA
jgi:hypothetical protein